MTTTPPSARATLVVAAPDTALAFRSGDIPVLGTPRLIALAEEATVLAAKGKLAKGQTSVGTRVRFDHLRGTPLGGTVTAVAELNYEDGRLLRFSVVAHDGEGRLVGEGEVTRVIVDAERFMGRL